MNLPEWVVKEVHAKDDYTLLLTFSDGEKKIYNARPLLKKPIYSQLNSLPFFLSVKLNAEQSCGVMM